MTKKLLGFLLGPLFLMTTDVMAATYSGTCGSSGSNVSWNLNTDDGLLTIKGNGTMSYYSDGSEIPWYNYKTLIKEVVVYEGVTHIGSYAFYECTGLTSITIPKSVKSIGKSAFAYCI